MFRVWGEGYITKAEAELVTSDFKLQTSDFRLTKLETPDF